MQEQPPDRKERTAGAQRAANADTARAVSIFAPLCVHIHNKAKGGQSLNTFTIWTNIDNSGKRHTLKRLQARARYGQRGQPKADTPAAVCVHIRPAMCPYPQQQRPTSEEEQHAAGRGVFCLAGRKGGERTASSVYSGERVEAKAGRPLIWTTWTI